MPTLPAHLRAHAIPAAVEASVALTPVLRRYPRASKALSIILAAQAATKALQTLRERLTPPTAEPESWTVTVNSDDDLYDHALAILTEHSIQNWRAVQAELNYDYDEDDDDADLPFPGRSSSRTAVIKAKPSERVERNFTIDGHAVFAYVDTLGSAARSAAQAAPSAPGTFRAPVPVRTPEVVFSASTEAGQAAILAALQDRAARSRRERAPRKPLLFTTGSWGSSWERGGEVPFRPVESVAVTDGQVQGVIDDINHFRAMEGEYVRRGIPFHRGYLLYGPPGTGKTSAVKAIAHAVGADLYSANLGSLNDASLTGLIQGVSRAKKGSILLLEDIDSFGAARQRDEDDEGDVTGITAGISTTGLLNALDGVETPHGLITILTTNHPEFLDDALIRPGRVDKKVFFGFPDDATVSRHFEFFFGRKPTRRLFANGRSGADLNEVLVAHMTDPDGAEKALSTVTFHVAPAPMPQPKKERSA